MPFSPCWVFPQRHRWCWEVWAGSERIPGSWDLVLWSPRDSEKVAKPVGEYLPRPDPLRGWTSCEELTAGSSQQTRAWETTAEAVNHNFVNTCWLAVTREDDDQVIKRVWSEGGDHWGCRGRMCFGWKHEASLSFPIARWPSGSSRWHLLLLRTTISQDKYCHKSHPLPSNISRTVSHKLHHFFCQRYISPPHNYFESQRFLDCTFSFETRNGQKCHKQGDKSICWEHSVTKFIQRSLSIFTARPKSKSKPIVTSFSSANLLSMTMWPYSREKLAPWKWKKFQSCFQVYKNIEYQPLSSEKTSELLIRWIVRAQLSLRQLSLSLPCGWTN